MHSAIVSNDKVLPDPLHHTGAIELDLPLDFDTYLQAQTLAYESDRLDMRIEDRDHNLTPPSQTSKGKQKSMPMSIRVNLSKPVQDQLNVGSSANAYQIETPPDEATSSESWPESFPITLGHPQIDFDDDQTQFGMDLDDQSAFFPTDRKGKARADPPVIPPLELCPSDFGLVGTDWPTFVGSIGSASSYSTGSSSPADHSPPFTANIDEILHSAEAKQVAATSTVSNDSLSFDSSKPPFNMERRMSEPLIKVHLSGKNPSNLARALQNRPSAHDTYSRDLPLIDDTQKRVDAILSDITASSPHSFTTAGPPLTITPSVLSHKVTASLPAYPVPFVHHVPVAQSESIVTQKCTRNYFDDLLPREVRLAIFSKLITVHIETYESALDNETWTVLKACSSKNRFVGERRGFRELAKISRVSKTWQSLALDGQLWQTMDLRHFSGLPDAFVSRLAASSGAFVKALDLSGHTSLGALALLKLSYGLRIDPDSLSSHTQLTTLRLQGCTNIPSSMVLSNLIVASPCLREVQLRGCSAVRRSTLVDLAGLCQDLEVLDISRCGEVDGEGILRFAEILWQTRQGNSALSVLRMSGVKYITDNAMSALGKAAPNLRVLDMSCMRYLHNSAIRAFVAATDNVNVSTVNLTPQQAGLPPGSGSQRRRVTQLRHLNLSSCRLLTDDTCSALAHAVPNLEYLEMGGIGPDLKDDGLIRLLRTTPLIRKIDLEDASSITDALLVALTPSLEGASQTKPITTQPGDLLESLNIGFAIEITDQALLGIIRRCSKLTVLQVDNTHVSGQTLTEFVQLSRKRNLLNAVIVANDCRGISESLVKELSPLTRPRLGFRSYEAKRLGFLDGRDNEKLGVGQNECDESRIVLKTFFSWQVVDAVHAAREKARKSGRRHNRANASDSESSSPKIRWWLPRSGASTPLDMGNDREGCTIM